MLLYPQIYYTLSFILQILLQDGYFVHFYAPPEIPPLPKQIVFVLDTSGSMAGTKLEQLKAAMYTILQELKEHDTFSFVEFESVVRVWNLNQTAVTVDWTTNLEVWENVDNCLLIHLNRRIFLCRHRFLLMWTI